MSFKFTIQNDECPYYYERNYCSHISNGEKKCKEESCVFLKTKMPLNGGEDYTSKER